MADIHFIRHRRPRQFRRIDRQLTDLNDEELRQRYRFSADNIDRLVGLVGATLARRTRRNRALTPRQLVLVTLRFLATGNFLQVIGDTFGLDISTVSRAVTEVTGVLFGLRNQVIQFPVTDDQRRRVMSGFYRVRGFPSVIGCLDGTHVRLLSPGQPDEAAFVNRKHYHSINVQACCDHKGLFTSVNACWPGSCHDSHVLRVSSLGRYLEAQHQDPERGYLLGDSGYPCRPFLLTPYLHPSNEREERYNRSHISTRNIIERVFGIWKRTFHVLHGEIRMKPHKVTRIIVACAVLHNLRIRWGEPRVEGGDDLDQPPADLCQGQMDGRGVRNYVANRYFQNQ